MNLNVHNCFDYCEKLSLCVTVTVRNCYGHQIDTNTYKNNIKHRIDYFIYMTSIIVYTLISVIFTTNMNGTRGDVIKNSEPIPGKWSLGFTMY